MPIDWPAIWLTFRLAAATSAILLALGLPLAYWLATTRWRGRFLIEALVALPIVLPPTVLGFYVLTAVGRSLAFSFAGILVGSVLFNLPFAVRPFTSAFAGVDRRFVEASWCLGVSRVGTFLRLVLPLSWAGILTGVILSFAHTVGEFGVVLMVGGNIPGATRTLSVVLYDQVQAMDYTAAHATALGLLGFAFLTLSVVYALQRRVLPL